MESETIFDSITISDNYMFQTVMMDPVICKEVVEMFLGFKLKGITYPEPEKGLINTPFARSVRFDVYAEDLEGNAIDIEMQNVNPGDLAKRSRYYQAMIDSSMIQKGGKGYFGLKKCFIIFLCKGFDPFGIGEKFYRFSMRDQDGYCLKDGAVRIFACTEGKSEDVPIEILQFLSYLKNGKPTNDLTEKIDTEVNRWKTSARWRKKFMENHAWEWDFIAKGEAKGEAKAERRLAELLSALEKAGKAEAFLEAVKDKALREQLFAEYNIQ